MAARIREVQETRGIGPIMPALPLPWEGEFMVHITLLQGRSVRLKFDQQPPAGSIPVPAGEGHWSGNLIFIDPTGEMWIVPNVWYNRTWGCRVEELELALDRYQTLIREAQEAERKLSSVALRTREEERDLRDAQFRIRQETEVCFRTTQQLAHIRKHADMDECPTTSPIPGGPDRQ